MESGILLGIDHGGSTTTALVYAPEDGVLASASVPMPKRTPAVGIVEHDARDFLITSIEAGSRALGQAGLSWRDVRAVGIANQGETSIAWSDDGSQVFGPAISWEDRRTSAFCDRLKTEGVDSLVRERTGIMLDSYFSASKFHWLTHEIPEAREAARQRRLRLGGTDSFVIHALTRGCVHATDAGTASRTALFDIHRVDWSPDLLAAFDLERDSLPEIRWSRGDFGAIDHPDIPAREIPIMADVVDAHAALFAQRCFDRTVVKATYGTGAFIEVNTGKALVEPDAKLPVFIAWQIEETVDYTLEGGVFSVGAAIDWAVRTGLTPSAATTSDLAESVTDAGGVFLVPSFTGLAAPHWVTNARAAMLGLGLDTTPGHIARALLDGIAFSCAEVIDALNQRLGGTLRIIRADGGPTRNPYLMQRQADIVGMPVVVSDDVDMTAMGAALLAGLGVGALTLADIEARHRKARTYEPRIGDDERVASWEAWRRRVQVVRELAG